MKKGIDSFPTEGSTIHDAANEPQQAPRNSKDESSPSQLLKKRKRNEVARDNVDVEQHHLQTCLAAQSKDDEAHFGMDQTRRTLLSHSSSISLEDTSTLAYPSQQNDSFQVNLDLSKPLLDDTSSFVKPSWVVPRVSDGTVAIDQVPLGVESVEQYPWIDKSEEKEFFSHCFQFPEPILGLISLCQGSFLALLGKDALYIYQRIKSGPKIGWACKKSLAISVSLNTTTLSLVWLDTM